MKTHACLLFLAVVSAVFANPASVQARRDRQGDGRGQSVSVSFDPARTDALQLTMGAGPARPGQVGDFAWVWCHPRQLNEVRDLLQKFNRWTAQSHAEKIAAVSKELGTIGTHELGFRFRLLDGGKYDAYIFTPRGIWSEMDVAHLLNLLAELPTMLEELAAKIESTKKAAQLK